MVAIGVAAFERFFRQAADLDVDKADLKRYESFVRDKIADLLTIAQARARADERDVIESRDLPITKGLQESITVSEGSTSPRCGRCWRASRPTLSSNSRSLWMSTNCSRRSPAA
jgi:hypothetical protein